MTFTFPDGKKIPDIIKRFIRLTYNINIDYLDIAKTNSVETYRDIVQQVYKLFRDQPMMQVPVSDIPSAGVGATNVPPGVLSGFGLKTAPLDFMLICDIADAGSPTHPFDSDQLKPLVDWLCNYMVSCGKEDDADTKPPHYGLMNASWFCRPEHMKKTANVNVGWYNQSLPLARCALAEFTPRKIVVFGSDAFNFIHRVYTDKAPTTNFTDCVGKILPMPDGADLLVCRNPRRIFENPERQIDFDHDMQNLGMFLSTGEVSRKESCEFTLINTVKDAMAWATKRLTSTDVLYGLDTEWSPGRLRTIQVSVQTNRLGVKHTEAVVFELFKDDQTDTELGADKPTMGAVLEAVLNREQIRIVGHNLRGDLLLIKKELGANLIPQFCKLGCDTMLAYHLIPGNETMDKGLKAVAPRILGVGRWDYPINKWLSDNGLNEDYLDEHGYGEIPGEILYPYAAMDAYVLVSMADPLEAEMLNPTKDSLQLGWEAKQKEMGNLQETTIWPLYRDLVMAVNEPVAEMEETGLLIDVDRLSALSKLFQHKFAKCVKELQEMINWKPRVELATVQRANGNIVTLVKHYPGFNPESPQQVRAVLFDQPILNKDGTEKVVCPAGVTRFNLTPITATDGTPWAKLVKEASKGRHNLALFTPSTDGETLEQLVDQCEFAKLLSKYRTISQLCKMYAGDAEHNDDGSIEWTSGLGTHLSKENSLHTSFRIDLETGRYSTRPNMQNLPKRKEKDIQKLFKDSTGALELGYYPLRTIIVARPGCVLYEADWNQAELWTLGALARDEHFLHTLAKSDMHTTVMRKAFGNLPYGGKFIRDFSVQELNHLRDTDKILDSYRSIAKTIVFGIPYGRGAGAIAGQVKREGLKCSNEEAQGYIDLFFDDFKQVCEFLNTCKGAVISPRYIRNPYGRYRQFPTLPEDQNFNSRKAAFQREAVNFPIQSTVGDSMSRALLNLVRIREELGNPDLFHIVLSIHDAILLEVPVKHLEQVHTYVVPEAMINRCEVPRVGLKYSIGKPDVMLRWGEKAKPEELEALGVPRPLCGFKEKK